MFCGVGGQGILLASDLLSQTILEQGMDVKKSEVHGMSQRGGTVVSSIRFGDKVYSPLIGRGDVDILLAFEKLEGLRQLENLKTDGIVIVNDFAIDPLPVACGLAEYPEEVIEVIKETIPGVIIIDGLGLAKKAGSARSMNIVLFGALAKKIELDSTLCHTAIEQRLPQKTWEVNTRAFDLGYSSV
jgi:indolepyruvate ferredoxin oxidoreductase beta subunit